MTFKGHLIAHSNRGLDHMRTRMAIRTAIFTRKRSEMTRMNWKHDADIGHVVLIPYSGATILKHCCCFWAAFPWRKVIFNPFPKRQILDPSKLNEFVDGNFKFDGNSGNLSKRVENTVGNGEIARYDTIITMPKNDPVISRIFCLCDWNYIYILTFF